MNKTKSGFKNLYLHILFILLIGGIGIQTFTSCSRPPPPPPRSQFNIDIQYTSFTDSRDGKTYKIVKIGEQTWMAENLGYYHERGSKCYEHKPSYCETYGRLYNWETALYACPAGWHLPSDAEWTALENAVGDISIAGTKLKARSGWNKSGNGTDDFGFSALSGGYSYSRGGFRHVSNSGLWWSATEYDRGDAWGRRMLFGNSRVGRDNFDKSYLFSVRCVQNAP